MVCSYGGSSGSQRMTAGGGRATRAPAAAPRSVHAPPTTHQPHAPNPPPPPGPPAVPCAAASSSFSCVSEQPANGKFVTGRAWADDW